MTPIQCFSLEGRGESPNSFLLRDGQRTGTLVPGVEIFQQYAIDNGRYLLITDYNCPYEETPEVVVLDERYRVLAKRRLGKLGLFFVSKTYLIKEIQWVSECEFVAIPHNPADGYYRCVIRPSGIPFFAPMIRTQFFSDWNEA